MHNNLANLLLQVDDERALAAGMRAHEFAPENAAVLDTLGWMLIELGELERGNAQLCEAVARNRRSPTLLYHLAAALDECGNRDEARMLLQQAVSPAHGLSLPGSPAQASDSEPSKVTLPVPKCSGSTVTGSNAESK